MNHNAKLPCILLLILTISVLAIGLLKGTGEAKIALASHSGAKEAADSRVPYRINSSNVTQQPSPAFNIPGRIEAEDYKPGGEGVGYHDTTSGNSGKEYRSDDVDIKTTLDIGGGYKISATATGEWLAFDVLIEEAWSYKITARVASGEDDPKSFHIEVDDIDVTGLINFADASGYESFVDVIIEDVSLPAGQHELRFVMDSGYFNFNYLDVVGLRPPLPPVIRVLPMGDSITHGNSKHMTYRYPLWTKLIDSGFNADGTTFDFVGSQSSNHDGDPVWPEYKGHLFDPEHEGHSGWRAEEILGGLPAWLEVYTPDVVLLHIGTNDAFDSQGTPSTVSEITQLIDVLRANNPLVIVLLAKIIPLGDPVINQRINELNSQMDGIATAKSTMKSPVVVVDQNTGFIASEDTYDGIHPNLVGEEKMAQKWFDAIVEALH